MRLEYCLRAKPSIWGVFVGPMGLSFLSIEINAKKLVVRISYVFFFFFFFLPFGFHVSGDQAGIIHAF